MNVTIDYTPEEAQQIPHLEEAGATLGSLVENAIRVKRNREALFRFQDEVFNGHDWSTETLAKHLTDDFIDHAAMPGDLPGFAGVQSRFSAWQAAFDSAMEDTKVSAGQSDMLAVVYDLHARHEGEFMGIEATHQPVVIPGIEFLRFRDGKIAAHWGIYDFRTTADEIGTELRFVPRAMPARKPEVAWSHGITPEDQASE